MEYDIESFTSTLISLMYAQFPYESDVISRAKHKKRPLHIRDVAFKNNEVIKEGDTMTFEIGNVFAEEKYPYYHILEDAPVIRKRGRGTKKSKGSQAEIVALGERDYNRITWNGKTYTKEYARNVRGKRSRIGKVSHWGEDESGESIFINREANSYLNIHYKYIEKMLNEGGILDTLAITYNLKRKRTVNTGLEEDYLSQGDGIVDIMDSHD